VKRTKKKKGGVGKTRWSGCQNVRIEGTIVNAKRRKKGKEEKTTRVAPMIRRDTDRTLYEL